VGVVAIAGSAAVVQSPTTNVEDIEQAIDRVQLQRGTALGSGLAIALAALLPDASIDVDKIIGGGSARPGEDAKHAPEPSNSVPPGSNDSVAIVLLSDGESNVGPDPLKVAEIAADKGVRVYTVGIGTPEGATLTANGWSMRVHLDEQKLTKIAAATGAEYFRAGSANELKKVYQSLGARLVMKKRQSSEVTALFVALGAALAMTGALVSLFRFNRIV
jgi:Ca-activated chloride channel family protein